MSYSDLPPITAFTFFAELSWALPVEDQMTFVSMAERTPAWDGWSPRSISAILGEEAPDFEEDRVPGTRVVARHAHIAGEPPLLLAEELFLDWVEPVLSQAGRDQRRREREHFAHTGFPTVRTVVALSRFVPRSEHPAARLMTVAWLTRLLRAALLELNTFLDELGMVARDWAIGGLGFRDLPAIMPVLVETVPVPAPERHLGAAFAIPIHDDVPVVEDPMSEEGLGPLASRMFNAANHGALPFHDAFPWFHRAFGEKIAGSPGRCVVELATGMEVLFSALVRAGGAHSGWDPTRIATALGDRLGVTNRVRDHIAPLLGITIDLEDENNAWGRWWKDGYQLRNRAVHLGHAVTNEEADNAWSAASALLSYLRTLLALHPSLRDLADQLGYELGGEPPWFDERIPVTVFPWDPSPP